MLQSSQAKVENAVIDPNSRLKTRTYRQYLASVCSLRQTCLYSFDLDFVKACKGKVKKQFEDIVKCDCYNVRNRSVSPEKPPKLPSFLLIHHQAPLPTAPTPPPHQGASQPTNGEQATLYAASTPNAHLCTTRSRPVSPICSGLDDHPPAPSEMRVARGWGGLMSCHLTTPRLLLGDRRCDSTSDARSVVGRLDHVGDRDRRKRAYIRETGSVAWAIVGVTGGADATNRLS